VSLCGRAHVGFVEQGVVLLFICGFRSEHEVQTASAKNTKILRSGDGNGEDQIPHRKKGGESATKRRQLAALTKRIDEWTTGNGADSHSETMRPLLIRGLRTSKRKVVRAKV
jgi:hypothetical protein